MGNLKNKLLRKAYALAPFDLNGDWNPHAINIKKDFISCLVCVSNRPKEFESLLFELSLQTLSKDHFEIVIVNDGAGDAIRTIADHYRRLLPIQYHENESPAKVIGLLRNKTLSLSRGEYILFLDDDTRILQNNFLEHSLEIFKKKNPDAIIPWGEAAYGLVKLKYDFFDHFSFGNAGVLYKRAILEQLKGFNQELQSYEDIELSIRLAIINAKILRTKELVYWHPPFYFYSMQKPFAIGKSVMKIRKKYSPLVWLFVYFNSLRFLIYGLSPNQVHRQWFKISLGIFLSTFKKGEYYF